VSREREKAAKQVPAEPVSGPRLTGGHEIVVEKGDIEVSGTVLFADLH
jgi:hypothetical protein